jgi:hypothetical protein
VFVSCQSSRLGERHVYIRRYESVEIVAYGANISTVAIRQAEERLTSFNPNAFGANSRFRTLPRASINNPHSIHRFPGV